MKKLTILLTALALLLLLCACRDGAKSADGTTENAAVRATETTAPAAEPAALATEQTPTDTEAAWTAPAEAESAEERSGRPHALTDNTSGVVILEPTEPTIGLPTPVEPTYEIEDAELPSDDFD